MIPELVAENDTEPFLPFKASVIYWLTVVAVATVVDGRMSIGTLG